MLCFVGCLVFPFFDLVVDQHERQSGPLKIVLFLVRQEARCQTDWSTLVTEQDFGTS